MKNGIIIHLKVKILIIFIGLEVDLMMQDIIIPDVGKQNSSIAKQEDLIPNMDGSSSVGIATN